MRADVRRRLALHALYLALSLIFATRVFSLRHPGSHAMLTGDPPLMCSTLQWVSHALVHDPRHIFTGNTFYPYPRSIVLTDAMVSLAIVNVPVRWFTSNPWVGYNLLIVAAYYLSCVWGAALARRITGSETAGVWGGLFWAFLFFRVHQIGHLQILSFQVMPAAVLAWLNFRERPAVRPSLLFALAVIAQALVSWYLAVILATILIVVALGRPVAALLKLPLRRRVGYVALALATIVLVIAPFALPYAKGFSDSSLMERRALVDTFGDAVSWRDYLTPPTPTLAGRMIRDNPYWLWGENSLYVGFVPLLLSAVAIVGAWQRRVSRRWALIGLALVVVGFVLALGFVSPRLGIPLPLHYLAGVMPFLAGLRATQRFSLVLYMGVLILSSLGMWHLLRSLRHRFAYAVAAGLCALFLVEVFPVSLPIDPATRYEVSAPDRFIADLQRERTAPLVVLHLPIYYFREAYPVSEAVYMLDSTAHWARILNGFSGAVPDGFMARMEVLNTLPSASAVNTVLGLSVDVIALHADAAVAGPGTVAEYFSNQPWSRLTRLPNGEAVVVIDRAAAPFSVR
jgi:hypothetical protein